MRTVLFILISGIFINNLFAEEIYDSLETIAAEYYGDHKIMPVTPTQKKSELERKGYVHVSCSAYNTRGEYYGIKCYGEYEPKTKVDNQTTCRFLREQLLIKPSHTAFILELLKEANCEK